MPRFAIVCVLALLLVPAALSAQAAPPTAASWSLGPGDWLRVAIWREKKLDGEFQVDEAGRLTLPLIGTRQVIGLPWVQLRDSLLVAYDRELKAPSVILTPLRRVYVLGEVTKPGLYLADPTLSLAGAVAMAGGAGPQGDLRRLRVVRNGVTLVRHAPIESQLLQADVRSLDQIFVDRRSWFALNSTFVGSAVLSLAGIIVTLVRR